MWGGWTPTSIEAESFKKVSDFIQVPRAEVNDSVQSKSHISDAKVVEKLQTRSRNRELQMHLKTWNGHSNSMRRPSKFDTIQKFIYSAFTSEVSDWLRKINPDYQRTCHSPQMSSWYVKNVMKIWICGAFLMRGFLSISTERNSTILKLKRSTSGREINFFFW